MKMSTLLKGATILALTGTAATAGGLDRSGQPVSIIFDEGNRLELSAAMVRPDVDGDYALAAGGATLGTTGNGQQDYSFFTGGYRHDLKGGLSFGLVVDEPYGSNVEYNSATGLAAAGINGITGQVSSRAVTGLLRYEMQNGFSVHGGLRAQRADAVATLPTAVFTGGYAVRGEADTSYGGVFGVAYERPEIALRVAATYSTEIEHDVEFIETTALGTTIRNGQVEFPESVNLEFQSGLNQSTLLFGSVRWAAWDGFTIAPPTFTAASGNPLVSFSDDGWDYNIGIARRINENVAASFSIGYQPETDTTNPSLFSPSDGRISYGLAGIFNYGNADVTVGVRYTDLGDEVVNFGTTPAFTANYSDNSAISFGVQFGFQL